MSVLEKKEKLKVAREKYALANAAYSGVVQDYDEKLKALREEFESQNADSIHEFKMSKLQMEVAEDELRAALIENYKETGEKTFDKNLSVRVTTSVKFPTEKALEWAKTNAPFLVQEVLDKKGFEPIAKAKKFDFVEIEETAIAVISKTLD